MRVFISSVRKGLEQERDSLPGLLRALGHDPRRFEDFTAQSVPSREACLRGVDDSDAYLLLLGPHYGTPFPETGRSATHEEYIAAHKKGIPRLVFRKRNVEVDAQQVDFAAEVEAYGTGVFRDSFDDAADLQAKVATALRDLPMNPLAWQPLGEPVIVTWRDDWSPGRRQALSTAQLDLHAVPLSTVTRSRRQLGELPEQIARRLRTLEIVPPSAPIDIAADDVSASATVGNLRASTWREPDHGGFLGCRLDAAGQRSAWERLPSDSMGTILDPTDLGDRIARNLRILGGIAPLDDSQYALAIELAAPSMTVVGSISQLGQRTSASGFSTSDRAVRIEPDESVNEAAFDAGAPEVAFALARHLVEHFSRQR